MAQSVQQGSGVQQQVTLARADGETTSGVGELLANTHHLHLQGGDTRSFQVSENIFLMFKYAFRDTKAKESAFSQLKNQIIFEDVRP